MRFTKLFIAIATWLAAGTLFLFSSQGYAQENHAVSLTQAINIALANNTDIKRSLLTLENAEEQVRLAWSEVLPDISGSASYTRNLEIPVNFVPAAFFDPDAPPDELVPLQFGTDNNWTGGLTVSQTLFRGEAVVGIRSSRLYQEAQNENLRSVTQQIVTQTRLAYYNVLVAEEQLRLQESAVERLRENLEENRSRQRAGLVDEYDVMQVEVQLSNQEPQLIEAGYAVAQAYRQLRLVLGVPMELSLEAEGDLSTYNVLGTEPESGENGDLYHISNMNPYEFVNQEELINMAAGSRGDIRVLDKQNELQNREISAIKSRFLPTLSADYNLNWTASQAGNPVFFGTEDTRARSQTLGLTLSVPIFQGFQRNANLSIARIEKKDLEEQRRHTLLAAENEIESARENLDQSIETATAREKALEQASEGYRRARVRLENGLGSQLDVTNAEQQLREAEVNYAQMVYDYLSAKANYDQAVGRVPFVDTEIPADSE